jgi:hypothetical protein
MFDGRSTTKSQNPMATLDHGLNTDTTMRSALMEYISRLSKQVYTDFKPRFLESLSESNRQLYTSLCKIPYAQKDWWRDQHDIIVARSMAKIIEGEAVRGNSSVPLWLISVALIHDRGYGVLANLRSDNAEGYLSVGGAHWENIDIRLRHSFLSRELAEVCLYGRFPEKLNVEPFATVGRCSPAVTEDEEELFLEIVEKHDHPLIQKYEALPALGRHHFDADSLYSISLSSFVKDFLSYLGDEKKREQVLQSGIFNSDTFSLRDLLLIRLSRYYAHASELPKDWPVETFPLNTRAVQLAEGCRCIVPHSETAKHLTDCAFNTLRVCVEEFERALSVEAFTEWFSGALNSEMERRF